MPDIEFITANSISDDDAGFIVLAARCDGKWIFVRGEDLKWHIPFVPCGDDIPRSAAKNLLFKITGCANFFLDEIALFKTGTSEYGMIFYADIASFCTSSDAELFDIVPTDLEPAGVAQSVINCVNGWLCNQNSKGEIWDVYDKDRKLTGRHHRRGDELAEGDYHLVVHVWMKNSKGEFLITKRTANKGFPNMWESTGGSALLGDDSLDAALREVKEETGLSLDPERGRVIHSYRRYDCFVDVWLFEQDFDLSDVVLQENETCDKMYASEETIRRLAAEGKFVPYSYFDMIFK